MKDKTKELSDEALEPLAQFVAKRGGLNELAEMVTKRGGRKVHRQNVATWLNPDKKERVQPRYGMGLLLEKIASELLGVNIQSTNGIHSFNANCKINIGQNVYPAPNGYVTGNKRGAKDSRAIGKAHTATNAKGGKIEVAVEL